MSVVCRSVCACAMQVVNRCSHMVENRKLPGSRIFVRHINLLHSMLSDS